MEQSQKAEAPSLLKNLITEVDKFLYKTEFISEKDIEVYLNKFRGVLQFDIIFCKLLITNYEQKYKKIILDLLIPQINKIASHQLRDVTQIFTILDRPSEAMRVVKRALKYSVNEAYIFNLLDLANLYEALGTKWKANQYRYTAMTEAERLNNPKLVKEIYKEFK